MNNLTIKREVTDFLLGSALGVLGLFLIYLLDNMIVWFLASFFDIYYSDAGTGITLASAIIAYLLISRYLFYKHNPFMAFGFLLGLFTPFLFIALVIIEIIIHPPSEE
jgi:hypothetical protein